MIYMTPTLETLLNGDEIIYKEHKIKKGNTVVRDFLRTGDHHWSLKLWYRATLMCSQVMAAHCSLCSEFGVVMCLASSWNVSIKSVKTALAYNNAFRQARLHVPKIRTTVTEGPLSTLGSDLQLGQNEQCDLTCLPFSDSYFSLSTLKLRRKNSKKTKRIFQLRGILL